MNANNYNKRRMDIRSRAASTGAGYVQCAVLGCEGPSTAYEGAGLNRSYCRRHVDHYARHGSYSKPSYSAAELNPYRSRAYEWLQTHRELPEVREAVDRVGTLYWRAGRPVEAFRLAGLPPHERAKVVWARLSQYKVDHLQVLAIWLAVQMRHRDDVQPERKIEFRRVQAAKVLHRLAGGSHKRWEHEVDGRVEVTELHKYPASRGRILMHIGRLSSWAAAPLEGHVEALLEEYRRTEAGSRRRLRTMRRR